MTNDTTETKPRAIETRVCGRCGGTGHYSYCSMYGTRCFGCSGAKAKYTKRGAAAAAFLQNLRSRKASDLRVGMLVFIEAGPFNKGGFKRIAEVSDGLVFSGCSVKNQATGEYVKQYGIKIECAATKLDDQTYGLNEQPDALKRVGHTGLGKAATLKLALDYQDTLTKTGTLRKGAALMSVDEILANTNTSGWLVQEVAQ